MKRFFCLSQAWKRKFVFNSPTQMNFASPAKLLEEKMRGFQNLHLMKGLASLVPFKIPAFAHGKCSTIFFKGKTVLFSLQKAPAVNFVIKKEPVNLFALIIFPWPRCQSQQCSNSKCNSLVVREKRVVHFLPNAKNLFFSAAADNLVLKNYRAILS